jgi:hypothetical protein
MCGHISKILTLTNGKECIVDDDDFEWLSSSTWREDTTGYVVNKKHGKIRKMHRLVTNAQHGDIVDHINGNKLDNRKENLRLCNSQQNAWNKAKVNANTSSSKYKGVCVEYGAWRATIKCRDQTIRLGRFSNELAAATAYNRAARHYFGEYARLNDIQELDDIEQFRCKSKSRYHGVREKKPGIWCVIVAYKKKVLYYKRFFDEMVAAYVYNLKVKELNLPNKLNDVPDVPNWEEFIYLAPKTSEYSGVSLHGEKWQATVKEQYVGLFQTEIEAAKAYNQYVIDNNITTAKLNEIKEEPDGNRLEEFESQQTQGQY